MNANKAPENSPKPLLEVFRAGRHVDSSGVSTAFSDDDLKATAKAYDPQKHEAPIVVGHPQTDAPAYGWVSEVKFNDGRLQASPHDVDPDFSLLVKNRRFSKISASFYTPDSPSNPVPGVYYLRHVGFLGAMPPAVKGMKTPAFAEDEKGVVLFEESQSQPTHPQEPAMTDDEKKKLQDELAAEQAKTAALTKELASFSEKLKAEIADKHHKDNAAFCDALIEKGTMTKDEASLATSMLDHFSDAGKALEFGEGDLKKPLSQAFKAFLSALPQKVAFGEIATHQAVLSTTQDFASVDNLSIDQMALALHKKASALQMKDKSLSYLDAIRQVS